MSKEDRQKVKKTQKIRAETPIPTVSLKKLHSIIKLFYYANAHQEPKSGSEIATKYGERGPTVSGQVGFLQQVGILQQAGKKSLLSEQGVNLCIALDTKDEETIFQIWKKLLFNYEPVITVIDKMKAKQTPFSEEDVLNNLKVAVGLRREKPSNQQKTGLSTLLDLMVKSGLITKTEDNKFLPNTSVLEEETESEKEIEIPQKGSIEELLGIESLREWSTQEIGTDTNEGISININIQLEINSTDDPEKIKAIIMSIREAATIPLELNKRSSENKESEVRLDQFLDE